MRYKFCGREVIYHVFEYLLALTLVLNCRSIWVTLPAISWLSNALLGLMSVSVLGCILFSGRLRVNVIKKAIALVTGIAFYSALFLAVNAYNRVGFFKFIIAVCMLAFYYCCCCNKGCDMPSLLYKYESLIVLIAGISLVMWFLCSIVKIVPSTGTVYSIWTGSDSLLRVPSYFGIYYETQYSNLAWWGRVARNTAVFAEAPMASFHFSMALLIELFGRDRNRRWKNVLLGAAILSTFSTTGYVVAIVAFVSKYLYLKNKNKFLYVLKVFIAPAIIIAGGSGLYFLVTRKVSTTGSGMIRLDDLAAGYKAWMSHPIFGSGYANTDYIKRFMSGFRSNNTGFSNTIMNILANGGIYLLLPYAAAFLAVIHDAIHSKDLKRVVFAVEVLFMFSITIVGYQYISIFLLIWFALGKSKVSGKI